jgi:hypothetical protein
MLDGLPNQDIIEHAIGRLDDPPKTNLSLLEQTLPKPRVNAVNFNSLSRLTTFVNCG